jgi:pyruvate ferredoxin oxidoreductase gamma subunit
MNNLEQIRIHGRGGQGVVTAAELIAIAAFYDGQEAQAFPNFGVERSGAPIQSFVRISNQKIITRAQIYHPTVLIIQDATLLDIPAIFRGADKNTRIIVNAPAGSQPELTKRFPQTYFSPATEIAMEILGKNIVNTVILGAFAKHTGLISLASLEKAVAEKFADKGENIINKNIKAIAKAYED